MSKPRYKWRFRPTQIDADLPSWTQNDGGLVFREYRDGEVFKEVHIELSPTDVEDVARQLHRIITREAQKVRDMADAMTSPHTPQPDHTDSPDGWVDLVSLPR